jgi:ankyrin repeat protein
MCGPGGTGWFSSATALFLAARWGHTPEVCELLQAQADVELPLTDGPPTALHVAAFHGHAPTVAVLLRAGADTSRMYQKLTARAWAAKNGHAATEKVFATHAGELTVGGGTSGSASPVLTFTGVG